MVSELQARQQGARLGIDWGVIDIEQFRRGIEIEMGHGASLEHAAEQALQSLRLDDVYYAEQELAAAGVVERGEPPSTYALLAAIEGQPNAWYKVASLTAVRAALIAPGLWLAGVRGWRLPVYSVMGSMTITGGLLVYYWAKTKRAEGTRVADA
jgi:hypothetical protein